MARKTSNVTEISLPFVGFLPRSEPLDAQPVYVASKSDHELLSIILQDEEAADKIMAMFSSIAEATSLNAQDFIRRSGLDAEIHLRLRVARELAARFAMNNLIYRPLMNAFKTVVTYLRIRMETEFSEQVRVLFLDNRHRLISLEVVAYGTVDQVNAHVDGFSRAASLAQGAHLDGAQHADFESCYDFLESYLPHALCAIKSDEGGLRSLLPESAGEAAVAGSADC